MKPFDLNGCLNDVYSRYPEAGRKPVIGLTGNFAEGETRLVERYYKGIAEAGGVPVVIPPLADKDVIINTLDSLDGLMLTGGGDINPLWAGEEPSPRLHSINRERDEAELLAVRLAYNRQIPMLGICRGIQVLVTALDGEVEQDIAEGMQAGRLTPGGHALLKHSQDADRREPTHTVIIEKDSALYGIYGTGTLAVNSFHHQSVRKCGARFKVTAVAPDGVIEAIESSEYKSIMGVQWHPEWLEDSGPALFGWLVGRAVEFSRAKDLHRRILTLDTHCDTPMFFPQGIHFEQRDPRILVDMHKMAEGRQDAVIMAAYLPQPKIGEAFSSKVSFDVSGPTEYADLIFDKIEAIVKDNNRYVSIARTPADLYEDKRRGRRSIIFADNLRPLHSDLRIIPCQSAFIARVVEIRTLITELRNIAQYKEAMHKTFRNIELFLIFFRQPDPKPLLISHAALSQIHCDIKHFPADNTHQFSLRELLLKMQSAENAFCGTGLIILNKCHCKTGLRHIVLIISLHKISAGIAVNRRSDHTQAFDSACILFYCNLPHFSLLLLFL